MAALAVALDEVRDRPVDLAPGPEPSARWPPPSITTSSPPVELGEGADPGRACWHSSSLAVDHQESGTCDARGEPAASNCAGRRASALALARSATRIVPGGFHGPLARRPRTASSSAARASSSPKKNSTQSRCSVGDDVPVVQLPPGRSRRATSSHVPAVSTQCGCGRTDVGHARGDGDQPRHPLGTGGRQFDRPPGRRGIARRATAWSVSLASRTATMSATSASVGCGARGRCGRPGSAVAPPVEGDHPVMTGEIGDLSLPLSVSSMIGVVGTSKIVGPPVAVDLVVDRRSRPDRRSPTRSAYRALTDATRSTKSRSRRLIFDRVPGSWENAPPPSKRHECAIAPGGLPPRRHYATGFDHACRGSPGSGSALQLSPLHRSRPSQGAPRVCLEDLRRRSQAPSPPCPRSGLVEWGSAKHLTEEELEEVSRSGRASRRGCTCPRPSEAVDTAARTSPRCRVPPGGRQPEGQSRPDHDQTAYPGRVQGSEAQPVRAPTRQPHHHGLFDST